MNEQQVRLTRRLASAGRIVRPSSSAASSDTRRSWPVLPSEASHMHCSKLQSCQFPPSHELHGGRKAPMLTALYEAQDRLHLRALAVGRQSNLGVPQCSRFAATLCVYLDDLKAMGVRVSRCLDTTWPQDISVRPRSDLRLTSPLLTTMKLMMTCTPMIAHKSCLFRLAVGPMRNNRNNAKEIRPHIGVKQAAASCIVMYLRAWVLLPSVRSHICCPRPY